MMVFKSGLRRTSQLFESIERGRWPSAEDALVAFRCACAQLGCTQLLELTVREYERVRAHARRFVVAVRHDVQGAEVVTESREGYVVVEKRGEAGRVAEAMDPRE